MLQRTRPWRPGLVQLEQHSTCTCHMPRAQRQLTEGGTEHRRMTDERHMRYAAHTPTPNRCPNSTRPPGALEPRSAQKARCPAVLPGHADPAQQLADTHPDEVQAAASRQQRLATATESGAPARRTDRPAVARIQRICVIVFSHGGSFSIITLSSFLLPSHT
eukprot:scaffold8586_cov108-Isochrysis_galbana.AAC.5